MDAVQILESVGLGVATFVAVAMNVKYLENLTEMDSVFLHNRVIRTHLALDPTSHLHDQCPCLENHQLFCLKIIYKKLRKVLNLCMFLGKLL